MSSINKNILLVNFDFPPNQGIGGRRWGKFAKQLAREGYVVHVIKADPLQGNTESPWTADVRSPHIYTYPVARKYPQSFSHPGTGLLSKLKYRWARFQLQRKEKGTIYDVSIGWEEEMKEQAVSLIKQFDIVNVIATGAPWNLLVYTARLKEIFPQINIIADFRDPWLNARNYGMATLDESRKKAEQEKFNTVMRNVNVVTSPNQLLTDEIKSHAPADTKALFEPLIHSFDPDDIQVVQKSSSDNKIRIVYGGDLYVELEPQLKAFRLSVEDVKHRAPEIYKRLEIRIFTNAKVPSILEGLEAIKVYPPIGKKLFNELSQADFCLILLSSAKRNEQTTKFFEYLPFRKPLLVFAPNGLVTDFVIDNKIGFAPLLGEQGLSKVLRDFANGTLDFNKQFDIDQFTLPAITQGLISFFK
jgi:hypothetical protein